MGECYNSSAVYLFIVETAARSVTDLSSDYLAGPVLTLLDGDIIAGPLGQMTIIYACMDWTGKLSLSLSLGPDGGHLCMHRSDREAVIRPISSSQP